mmetsp:Transcript_8140/g.19680  ORF Transcript_8140/g.19680 Transcript_8140/m.19680 type:complete len:224 (+) Transcript_8140:1371-2042(+)
MRGSFLSSARTSPAGACSWSSTLLFTERADVSASSFLALLLDRCFAAAAKTGAAPANPVPASPEASPILTAAAESSLSASDDTERCRFNLPKDEEEDPRASSRGLIICAAAAAPAGELPPASSDLVLVHFFTIFRHNRGKAASVRCVMVADAGFASSSLTTAAELPPLPSLSPTSIPGALFRFIFVPIFVVVVLDPVLLPSSFSFPTENSCAVGCTPSMQSRS